MHRSFAFLLLIALISPALPCQAHAVNSDDEIYSRAFSELNAGRAGKASEIARKGHDPVLNKIFYAYEMAQPGNTVSFSDMAEFVTENPDWPGLRGIIAIAEQKIPANANVFQVANWFTSHPPVSLPGFYRAADAFEATGQGAKVSAMVRIRWIEGDFSPDELETYVARFGRYLTLEDHWARLNRLLWNNDAAAARRMYALVPSDLKTLAEARLALANDTRGAENAVALVPASLQNNPGLLYERLRWLRKNNRDDEAISMLEHTPANLGKPEAWWDERQIIIRRVMDRHDFQLAYLLAAQHKQTQPKTLEQAEFLAGWLALRFLNQPAAARIHFQTLYDNASTPITRARGAYWLGRTYEALGMKPEAEQAYETAAALDITYYGQLATTRIYARPIITARPEPAIPAAVRAQFFDRDVIKAIERLHEWGQHDRAETFFRAVLDQDFERVDFVLMTELAYEIKRPDLAIAAAKAANQKNMLVAAGGFPILNRNIPSPPEPAFTHALIRQESMFNPDANSPAGAHGLMQLMPQTAQAMAKKLRVKFRKIRLDNPDYNLRLGTAFIKNQLSMFNGSYVLALAGYNAGPSRVREWINEWGDPRNPNVDPIDWIEMIPVAETRNYIQRILESLQIYRARLAGGQAPLLILKDLKR